MCKTKFSTNFFDAHSTESNNFALAVQLLPKFRIFSSQPLSSPCLKRYFLVHAEKYLTLDFVQCVSLWPQAHRFWSERD